MHLAILDNRRRHSWTNVWQRLQLLGVGSVDCQRSCCHSRDRYRWRLDSADNDMKVFETFRVEVIDDGPGLPEDIRGDIFDPFVSGRENGTGLGLALVSKIISDHDGWISVDSVPGRTVFRISLPRAPRESEENR